MFAFLKAVALGIFLAVIVSLFIGSGGSSGGMLNVRSVTIEGELVKFEYRSPHAWVHVDVTDERGASRQYAAEWANPNRLTRDDIKQDTLKIGDRVVITGSPGRNPEEYKLHLKRIQRPSDGWSWPGSRGQRNAVSPRERTARRAG